MFDFKKVLNNLKNMQTETITNENGTAIKLGDGTMICYGTSINNPNGLSTTKYPIDFIEPPISQQGTITYNHYTSVNPVYIIVQPGVNSINIYCRKMDGTIETSTEVKTNWLVIGRWK